MATYYLTITPINTLSTSTYSIYFNSIAPSNLIASGVPQSTLTGVGYPIDNTGRTSAIVKNEDPDCCCDAQSFVFPTPSPTATPTTTPTSQPTTATPTTQPTTSQPTPQPTTPQPTTPQPTTPQPTEAVTKVFSNWSFVGGNNNWSGNSSSGNIGGWPTGTSGTTYITGTLVVTGGSANISVCANPTGTSATVVANCSLTGAGTYNFTATANTAGSPVCHNQIVGPGTYTVDLSGIFGTNSLFQSVYIN